MESALLPLQLDEAARLPIAQIAAQLREWLSPALLIAITKAPDSKSVARWARGERPPAPERERILRFAYQLALIVNHHDTGAARVWFETYNAHLNTTPASMLRYTPLDHARNALIDAARAFAGV